MLLVEDEPDQAAILEAVLRHEGLDVVVASSGEQALEIHQRTPADVLVTDLNLPGMTGVDLMRRLSPGELEGPEPKAPPPHVVMVTGAASITSAVDALKLGAADYLQKPLDPARLVLLVRELLSSPPTEFDDDDPLHGQLVFEGMIGGSPRMREVFTRIDRVAATMAPVLIVGESGTGKELVARAIHNRSRRRAGPFVPVHTGAIPRELIGSELFGHEKGSFTGAFAAAEGKFEAAAGGTVFLDEVGTMDAAVQVSLLRVLETYRFTRVGGRKEIEADVRVVAATNKDLLDLVDDCVFREDLYYRLNVFTVTLPPLRERREDVLPIAERFLLKFAKRYGTPARRLSDAAVERLAEHDWPGNVRELRNVIEQTALFASNELVSANDVQLGQGRIERRAGRRSYDSIPSARVAAPVAPAEPAEPLSVPIVHAADLVVPSEPVPSHVGAQPVPSSIGPASMPRRPGEAGTHEAEPSRDAGEAAEHPLVLRLPVGTRLADAERKLILLTLEAVRGNKQRAARVLGISRRGLYSKLQAYGEHVGSHEAQGHSESAEPQDPVDDVPVVTDEPALEELGSARGDA
ncbi:sigma-54-dependent transcriptional regulator [Sorangium atrum]|uniref:Sigma-54 dependent transcriptional regulator n=1 Tax=Sorangium atrum TaxID=2995308 RepID=A0ABT5C405_9BACT|nr:sigma-54 dependent transcriptional regulator [Sorangium aterium]MDC0681148.1 sigma-54 dependent transcriptional regulator [Sorangium aterium]